MGNRKYYQQINVNLRPQDSVALDIIVKHLEGVNGVTDAVRHALLLAAAKIVAQQDVFGDKPQETE